MNKIDILLAASPVDMLQRKPMGEFNKKPVEVVEKHTSLICTICHIVLGILFFPYGIYLLCRPAPKVEPLSEKPLSRWESMKSLSTALVKKDRSDAYDYIKISLLCLATCSVVAVLYRIYVDRQTASSIFFKDFKEIFGSDLEGDIPAWQGAYKKLSCVVQKVLKQHLVNIENFYQTTQKDEAYRKDAYEKICKEALHWKALYEQALAKRQL